MNRAFEQGLDETCFRENVGLLAYSPLAFGQLTGKYADDLNAHGRLTCSRQAGARVTPVRWYWKRRSVMPIWHARMD
jgi:aryl-alcohol dehydrogenase-like predicted oxidoreductase